MVCPTGTNDSGCQRDRYTVLDDHGQPVGIPPFQMKSVAVVENQPAYCSPRKAAAALSTCACRPRAGENIIILDHALRHCHRAKLGQHVMRHPVRSRALAAQQSRRTEHQRAGANRRDVLCLMQLAPGYLMNTS